MQLTDLIVEKTEGLNGRVQAPPSKSYTHRALVSASLSEGESFIKEALVCDDTLATLQACSMLGAKIKKTKNGFKVEGVPKLRNPEDVIDCRDSGSTIRLITPLCALPDGISILSGNEGLRRRPMEPMLVALRQLGVQCYSSQANGYPPIVVFGKGITGGKASIRGDVSSQFISGLLFSTPKAKKDTEILLTSRLESKPYVEMTLDVLQKHGIKVNASPDYDQFIVPSRQKFFSFNHVIHGDYSSAAFLLSAATLTESCIKVTNLQRDSLQGDRDIVNILKEMGAKINIGTDYIEVFGDKLRLKGTKINVQNTPDLAPICAVLACFAQGKTVIDGVKRLRYKESNRALTLSVELKKMGGKIRSSGNNLIIEGNRKLYGAELDSHNDHRISMACTVAALRAEGKSIVHGINCINKSYPNFVKDLISLGGKVCVE